MMNLKYMIVSSMLLLAVGCSSSKKIDFAEYLFPDKNLIVEEKYGEVHTKSSWFVGWSDGSFIKKVETLAPADIRGTTEVKWNIEGDEIYITSRDLFTGELKKRKYADRYIKESGKVTKDGGEYDIVTVDASVDTVIGKLSPCIVVKIERKRGYSKSTYCKGYGEMQSEENSSPGYAASIVKVISIKQL